MKVFSPTGRKGDGNEQLTLTLEKQNVRSGQFQLKVRFILKGLNAAEPILWDGLIFNLVRRKFPRQRFFQLYREIDTKFHLIRYRKGLRRLILNEYKLLDIKQ